MSKRVFKNSMITTVVAILVALVIVAISFVAQKNSSTVESQSIVVSEANITENTVENNELNNKKGEDKADNNNEESDISLTETMTPTQLLASSNVASTQTDYDLEGKQILAQAFQLLGKSYNFGDKGAAYMYERNRQAEIRNANQFNSIDCSGLIYWSLAKLDVKTKGFWLNHPVPVDTDHWFIPANSDQFWYEITKASESISVYDQSLQVKVGNGEWKDINLLKVHDNITAGLRYYQYKIPGDNNVYELPTGTIIMAYGATNPNGGRYEDHSWITIGDLGTTDPQVAKSKIKEMTGVDIDIKYIKKSSETCTYWRIEAASGVGVYINNGDPDSNYVETLKNGTTKVKGIGQIWAFQISKSEDIKVDLALKKMITRVKEVGTEDFVNVTESNFNVGRHSGWNVNTSTLNNTTNATYTMNKTPVQVMRGDEIEYSIKIFNEGEITAKAGKINDYIPAGLTVKSVKYKGREILDNDTTTVTANVTNSNVLQITLHGEDDYLAPYNRETGEIENAEVLVVCEVTNNATGVLTNVAEIMEYITEDGTITNDIDSTPKNWVAPGGEDKYTNDKSSSGWKGYANATQSYLDGGWHTEFVAQDGGVHGNKGDDDDFDKVEVIDVDLALKKVITKVVTSDSEVQTIKRSSSTEMSWVYTGSLDQGQTNATYLMNKTPIYTKVGSEVTYRLYIFNEGKIDAKASEIIDYIPTGLEVTGVYYRDTVGMSNSLTDELNTPKSYFYDKNNGYLKIYLGDTDELIKAYKTYSISSDFVTVKCKVLPNAKGIITNMAEISKYSIGHGEIKRDIDSYSKNWKNPNTDTSNRTTSKNTPSWKSYIKPRKRNDLLDDNMHPDFIGSKYNTVEGLEDDDDFEKIAIVDDYKVNVQKVSSENTQNAIKDIKFYFGQKPYSEATSAERAAASTLTNEQGYTNTITKDITYKALYDEEDVFYIKEIELPANSTYTLIDKEFELRIRKSRYDTGWITIDGYSFNTVGGSARYKSLNEETSVFVRDRDGHLVNIRVSYNANLDTFTVVIPNNVENSNYRLQLLKTDSTTHEPIEGIKFGINTRQDTLTTDSNGRILFGEYDITRENYQNVDEFIISEVEDANSRYFTLKNPLTVKVRKSLDNSQENYIVQDVSLNNSAYSEGPITQQVELKNTSKKVTVRLYVEGNMVVLDVPNIPKDGSYNLSVKKVKGDGTTLYTPQTGFSLNTGANEVLTNASTGIAKLVTNKPITADNVNAMDIYTITETTAPSGYVKLKYPLVVQVSKRDNGDKYIVSSVKAYANNNAIEVNVNAGNYGTLRDVQLADGSYANVTIDLQNENNILVIVPNNNLSGKYHLQIFKYSKRNNDKNPVKDIKFFVQKQVSAVTVNGSLRTTNRAGLANITNIPIEKTGVDEYLITEIQDAESNYIALADGIRVVVDKDINSIGTAYIASDANFINGTKTTSVRLVNGETVTAELYRQVDTNGTVVIRLEIENPEIKGDYKVELEKIAKTDTGSMAIPGVVFKVNNQNLPATNSNGKVTAAEKTITYEDVNTTDTYTISEITLDNNKYIKLKNPLTLTVYKGKDTANTKFMVTKFTIFGRGITANKFATGTITNNTITLADIALVDDSVVDITVTLSEKTNTSTGKKYSNIAVTIPNKERKGNYSVNIKKVNQSNGNSNVQGATFKVQSRINGVNQAETTTAKTNSNGITNVADVTLASNTINQVDTFTVSEVKIYKTSSSNEEEIGYAKLLNPLTLSVEKEVKTDKFTVKRISLSQQGQAAITGTTSASITAELENGEFVSVIASVDSNNVITLRIPNKEITGSYGIDLVKTTNNFQKTLANKEFKYTGNANTGSTNSEGKINIVNNKKITKDNVNTQDTYEITEVEDKNDNYLELANKLTVKVSKTKANNKFVVNQIVLTSGNQSATITRGGNTNTAQLDNLATVNTNKKASVKVVFNETTQKIVVYADNPAVEGEYQLRVKKVNSVDSNITLENVAFTAVKQELDANNQYNTTKTNNIVTASNGYAIVSGNGTTANSKEKITNKNTEKWILTETRTKEDYEILKNIRITLTVTKKLSADGKTFIINTVTPSVTATATDSETSKRLAMVREKLQVNVNSAGTSVDVVVPNKEIEGDYSLDILKVEPNGTTKVADIPFSVTKNGASIISNEKTNSEGILSIGSQTIENVGTDTYVITEGTNANSKYVQLDEAITVKVNTTRNTDGTKYILGAVTFDNNQTQKTVRTKKGSTVTATVSVNQATRKVTITIQNEQITGKYSVKLKKVVGTTPISGVIFKVNGNNLPATDSNGEVSVVSNKTITPSTLSYDKYEVEEIQVDANKYVKLKDPVKLRVYKGKNATGTEYVVTRLGLDGMGLSAPIHKEGESSVTLEGVALANGKTVNVKATYNATTKTVTVEVPNREIKGDYSVQIKKVNASKNNNVVANATFKVESTINGVARTATTGRTNESGLVNIANVSLNDASINQVDTFKISEVKIYKEATGNEEQIKFVKLVNPLTLSVTKAVSGDEYDVSTLSLSQQGLTTVSGSNNITLTNVELESGEKVDVKASIDENNLITVTIPNKEAKGKYSLNLIKTTDNYQETVFNQKFTYTGNLKGSRTNMDGLIVIEENKEINQNNVNTPDEYVINEVEDTRNGILELKVPLTLTVEKAKVNGSFVVNRISLSSADRSVRLDRSSAQNSVELGGLATSVAGKTTTAKVVLDKNTDLITLYVNNPRMDQGNYSLKLLKVDSNTNNTLAGVNFDVVKREKQEGVIGYSPIGETKHVTSQADGYAYIYGDNPYTTNVTEPNEEFSKGASVEYVDITETSTISDYELLSGVQLSLEIHHTISEDGTKMIISDVIPHVSRTEYTDEAYDRMTLVREKTKVEVDNNAGSIVVILPNEKNVDYTFKLKKVDSNGNDVTGARFTVTDPNGEKILNNQTLTNGSYFAKDYTVKSNRTYKFVITENSAPAGYENLLNGFNLNVYVNLDSQGDVILTGSRIEIEPQSDNYNEDAYAILESKLASNKIKLTKESGNTAVLTVENPKVTSEYSLKLLKTEHDSTKPLANARFKVMKNGTYLAGFTTDSASAKLLDDVNDIGINETATYEIEEEQAPANYDLKFKKVRVVVSTNASGDVSAAITKILLPDEGADWIDYNASTHGNVVKIQRKNGTNEFTLKWENTSKYVLRIFKEGYSYRLMGSGYTRESIGSLPKLRIPVAISELGGAEVETTLGTPEIMVNNNVKANSEYVYTIRELQPQTGYNNDFENLKLVIHIRTDSNCRLIEANQNKKTQCSYYEIVDLTGTKTNAELTNLESQIKLNVDDATKAVDFYMVDMEEPTTTDYIVKLIKTNDDGTKFLQGAGFEVTLDKGDGTGPEQLDGSPDRAGIQDFVTNLDGVSVINNISFTPNSSTEQIHTFKITEDYSPMGYEQIDEELTLTVNLTNKTEMRNITDADISLTGVGNSGAYSYVEQGGTIYVVVPNHESKYRFTINKLDTDGNLIESSVDSQGVKQGVKLFFMTPSDSYGNYELNGDEILDAGKYDYEKEIKNNSYTHTYGVAEMESKKGYSNVLAGYTITVKVLLDSNKKIIPMNANNQNDTSCTSYTIRPSDTSLIKVTEEEAKEYINLKVVDDPDGIQHVILDLVNPLEYKVRLRKTDTRDKELDKAVVTGSILNGNTLTEMARIENGSDAETDTVIIKEGEQQTWIIKEESVAAPFYNILAGTRELHVVAKVVDGEFDYDISVHSIDDMGHEVISRPGSANPDFYRIRVSQIEEDGIPVIDVQIRNGVNYIAKVEKNDMNRHAINEAFIKIKNVTTGEEKDNTQDGHYITSASINEENMMIGRTNTYEISEIEANAPYYNILGDNKIFVKVRVNEENKIEIVGKGYIDENGNTHNELGKFAEYVSFDISTDNNLQTVRIRLQNPVKYKFRLIKNDENNDNLTGTNIEVNVNNEEVYNINDTNHKDYIEFEVNSENSEDRFVIKELDTAYGYNNDLKGMTMAFSIKNELDSFGPDRLKIYDFNLTDSARPGWYSTSFDSISDYFTYELIDNTADGIPVVEIKMKNSTDINLNIEKQLTNGNAYDGAELELYSVDTETNTKTLIKNNIVNDEKQYNIEENNINVLPNKTYTYAIKEVSTEAPHQNILKDDKEIRVAVRLNKNAETGELSLEHHFDICDAQGNVLANDMARDYINVVPELNEDTGKYTLNVYIKNPILVRMKFLKTDMAGNPIPGKANISINNVVNTGSAEETYLMDIGSTKTFTIREMNVQEPFENVLGDKTVGIVTRLDNKEKLSSVTTFVIDGNGGTAGNISQFADYLDYEIDNYDPSGIPTINIKLKNPVKFKVRVNKQDMHGTPLRGTSLQVNCDGKQYVNERASDYIEFEVKDKKPGDIIVAKVKENNSTGSFYNVFEGYEALLTFKVKDDYTLECTSSCLSNLSRYGIISLPASYCSLNIDNSTTGITATLTLKNPIKYDLAVVKEDLAGNELEGQELQLKVTKNNSTVKENAGQSTIKFEERDLAPNTVNTYVVEELSSIAPYVNVLENKKLTAQVRVDENGYIVVQKFEVTDKTNGQVIATEYVTCDTETLSEDGTRLVKIIVKNPLPYTYRLTKTDIRDQEINSADLQVNDRVNIDTSTTPATRTSKIEINEKDVKVGDVKRYLITESNTQKPFVNILENNKLFVDVRMNENTKLEIINKGYISENGTEHSGFGKFEEFVSVRIDTNNTTKIQTVNVQLINPMEYRVKLIKVDENNNPLPNADIQIAREGDEVYSTDGSSEINFLVRATERTDNYEIKELSSAFGYNNNLSGKTMKLQVSNIRGTINVSGVTLLDPTLPGGVTYSFASISDYFTYDVKQANETEDGLPLVLVKMKNTTDYSLNIIKHTTNGVPYSGAELELYELNTQTNERRLIKNNIVDQEKQANITLNEIAALPNQTQTFIIKEKSTTLPHMNILDDNKELRVAVKLEKNETTGALSFVYNYDIYDKNGNVLANDKARSFISFDVVQDDTTGKYTLNTYIENPVQFKMKFTKTDTKGTAIPGKAVIAINGQQNNGSALETYDYLKVDDTVHFEITESSTEKPFVNVLGNNKLIFDATVMDNEEIQVQANIPAEVEKFVSYDITTDADGVQVLDIKLQNPMEYKFRVTKQDMAGLGLEGADISVTYNGRTYSNNGAEFIEIPVVKEDLTTSDSFTIKEISSKTNYENVFEGKSIIVLLGVNNQYKLVSNSVMMIDVAKGGIISAVPNKYFNLSIDNMEQNTSEITANVVLKNPLRYNLEVVKVDLNGNEISGDGLQMKVTRNTDEAKLNQGSSTIKFEERDLLPNSVNKYVVEELSTIAPHTNELLNKKLTAEVRVDQDGNIVLQKFEVTDKTTGAVVASDYVAYDTNARSVDGTRLVKIFVKNPIRYKFKVIKTKTKTAQDVANNRTPDRLQGASIEVNNNSNVNGSSEVEMIVDDVKVGDTKVFTIKENATPVPYDNILKHKEIILKTYMGTNKKLSIIEAKLKDIATNESIDITENIKEQYRFDYDIVTGEDGFETVNVVIQNPVKVAMKVVKKDATGITELSGADIELKLGDTVVATNKETGSAVLEHTIYNVGRESNYNCTITENASVSPNENVLNGKELRIDFEFTANEKLRVQNAKLINKETSAQEETDEFENISVVEIDGVQTLLVELENPTGFDLDLAKNAAGVGFLVNTKFQVYKEGTQEALFDGYVTDLNTFKAPEVAEHKLKAGKYTYYITETKSARERYVNILENKYIKLRVDVSGTGKVTILDNNDQPSQKYFEVYEGNIANRTAQDRLIPNTDLIYSCIDLRTLVNNETGRYLIYCDVTNPVKYTVELEKVDSIKKPLEGAEFELVSDIINSQNAEKTEMDKTVGVDSIDVDGKVLGTTDENGNISYEETFVMVGTYEYTLKEIKTPGNQYVNPFEGYTIHFKVSVNKDGDIELVSYENGKNCYIEKNGVEAPEDIYGYLILTRRNNEIIAKLQIEVENPIRYMVKLDKDVYGEENLHLDGAKFKIESSLIKNQGAQKTRMSATTGVDEITADGVVSGTTNIDGNIEFEETMVRPGVYEYWISEIETGDKDILNALQGAYIKIYLKTTSDGTIYTVTDDEQQQIIDDGRFYLYDSTKQNKIDFDTTSIDELIKVYITKENDVSTLHVDIDNPQRFDLDMIKSDIDLYNLVKDQGRELEPNMNDVKFDIKAYRENTEGEKEEIELRKAYDNTNTFVLDELLTSTVADTNGMISLKDILIEKAGTYYFEYIETTPLEPIIYKDKSENVIVKVVIGINEARNKYVVESVEAVQGDKYVIDENTNVDDSVVTTNITNERVKGSYNLEILKLEELLGHPVQGAKFVIEAYKKVENEETEADDNMFNLPSSDDAEEAEYEMIKLYRSTDDVTSMDELIPGKFTIDSEDGIFRINKIRIENLDTYELQIREVKAPDTYTLLRDPIRLRVTPRIEGQYDDAKFVVDTIELISGDNDGLVRLVAEEAEDEEPAAEEPANGETETEEPSEAENTEDKDTTNGGTKLTYPQTEEKIKLEVTNNQFDLALRKFITSINGKDISRWTEPQVDTKKLITGEETTAEYYNNKLPLRIYAGQEIIYTIRVYNEGQIDGYVNKITDYLPNQLEFLPDDEFNTSRGWKYAEQSTSMIETDYLSKARNEDENVIKAFDNKTGEIDYVEVQVKCKVKRDVEPKTYITNIAEITEYEGRNRPNVVDRDSVPESAVIPLGKERELYKQEEIEKQQNGEMDYIPGQEDDDDFEKVLVERFDLALRKFITQVNDKKITSRIPHVTVDEKGKVSYKHDKTPLVVAHDNTVEYTIRIFNEGTVSGYADLVKDDIPAGLVFIPDDETNQKYRWKMLDAKGNETTDVVRAKYIVTDYLSVENGKDKSDTNAENKNLIHYFNKDEMMEPDYRDVKAVFKVNVPRRSDDLIINEAQISDDKDDFGEEVEDDDSTTDVWIEGEDDQDIEFLKVKYFDLALYKWVTEAIVTENGKTTSYPSNHTQDDKSNMLNVAIKKKELNNVTVKFKYIIKVENQGNLSGYAKEIKDHIPAGLKFVAEDNAGYGWEEQPDGTITNKCFENTLLKEGDTAEVAVILTWINSESNLGLKTNYAEISKDYNDEHSPDVDSTTDNMEDIPREDDEDGDIVLLQIRTGLPNYAYIIIAIVGAMMIVACGVFGIKKYVVNK